LLVVTAAFMLLCFQRTQINSLFLLSYSGKNRVAAAAAIQLKGKSAEVSVSWR
jgi:hypothetical protein